MHKIKSEKIIEMTVTIETSQLQNLVSDLLNKIESNQISIEFMKGYIKNLL